MTNQSDHHESLIERAEREAGCRWDDPTNDSALNILFGALARELGLHRHRQEDDVVTGTLLRYQMSEAGQREADSRRIIAEMLRAGVSPDDLKALLG